MERGGIKADITRIARQKKFARCAARFRSLLLETQRHYVRLDIVAAPCRAASSRVASRRDKSKEREATREGSLSSVFIAPRRKQTIRINRDGSTNRLSDYPPRGFASPWQVRAESNLGERVISEKRSFVLLLPVARSFVTRFVAVRLEYS